VYIGKRYVDLPKKTENVSLKNLIEKIQKLILKELKLNVNRHIKTLKNHNFQALSLVELRITHVKKLNNRHLYSSIEGLFCKVFFFLPIVTIL
jgi:hypothetical protein